MSTSANKAGDAGPQAIVAPVGLSEAEVHERIRRGQVNAVASTTTRSVWQIVRANLLTPFNFLLGALFIIMLVVDPRDALFGGVLVANMAIGIGQELRAKRTLDRLTLLTAPRARVVRSAEVRDLPVGDVVVDDVLELAPGAQVAVDGIVLDGEVEADESLLTGESDPVTKAPGDEVLSGSFVVAGSAHFRATRVGAAAYARSLAEEARAFVPVRSELRATINRIVVVVAWLLVPTGILLAISQLNSADSLAEAARGTVAGTVTMVPEGLVLLTSVALALSITRLGHKGVLVREMPAVEGLARIDVLCIDKTGTLTEGRMVVEGVESLVDRAGAAAAGLEALGALAASDPNPNATLRAIRDAHPVPAEDWTPSAAVPFSSARKWSAATFAGQGTWILGAPEMLLADDPGTEDVRARVDRHAGSGRRVLLLQLTQSPLWGEALPPHRVAHALVTLTDRIRPDAADTMRYFEEQGVTIKVISGDSPTTVAAIALQVAINGAESCVDARQLPTDRPALADALDRSTVFGRVVPRQKQQMVEALQSKGHVVAMTGDGVNDVLALKKADIGIAMGSGSDASRAVADLVLRDGSFTAMPGVVGEGRQVLANIERSAKLFLTKTTYAMLVALGVGVLSLDFPFLPRHLSLVGALTIGIPGFVLTLERTRRRAQPHMLGRVLRFAVPAGTMAAIASFTSYLWIYKGVDQPLAEARTAATITLFLIGLALVYLIARPLSRTDVAMLIAMAVAFGVSVALPAGRSFFEFAIPPVGPLALAVAMAMVVAIVVQLVIPGKLVPVLGDTGDARHATSG